VRQTLSPSVCHLLRKPFPQVPAPPGGTGVPSNNHVPPITLNSPLLTQRYVGLWRPVKGKSLKPVDPCSPMLQRFFCVFSFPAITDVATNPDETNRPKFTEVSIYASVVQKERTPSLSITSIARSSIASSFVTEVHKESHSIFNCPPSTDRIRRHRLRRTSPRAISL
jgi:hypothetical protein